MSQNISIHRHLLLGTRYSKEKAMAPHSSTLAWKIPWMAAVHGVAKSDMTERLAFTFHFHALEKEMGQGSLVGCRLWGCTE